MLQLIIDLAGERLLSMQTGMGEREERTGLFRGLRGSLSKAMLRARRCSGRGWRSLQMTRVKSTCSDLRRRRAK